MYYLDLNSFAVGLIMGVVGSGILLSFTAFLVVHYASESDKRGLAGRHRPESTGAYLLSDPAPPALPVVAPQKD
jgi:hypothetical protein